MSTENTVSLLSGLMKNATHVSCLLSSSRFVRSPGVNTACINRVPSGTGCKSLSLPRTVAGDYINFNYRANVESRRFRSAFCYCGMTRASFRFFPHQSGKKKKKNVSVHLARFLVSVFCICNFFVKKDQDQK